MSTQIPFRYDIVGSFLRKKKLKTQEKNMQMAKSLQNN